MTCRGAAAAYSPWVIGLSPLVKVSPVNVAEEGHQIGRDEAKILQAETEGLGNKEINPDGVFDWYNQQIVWSSDVLPCKIIPKRYGINIFHE